MFAEAFSLWGSPFTWLEMAAFALSLAMVRCNMRLLHWGWPLGIAASVLYGVFFANGKLYGEAGLQVVFVLVSVWGWAQWLRGQASNGPALPVRRLSPQQRWCAGLAGTGLVAVVGGFLLRFTDSELPWADAVPTGLSVLGQVLLGRKFIENWLIWLIVNLLSCALFTYKGWWLTVLLYAIFAGLSVLGWRAWAAKLENQAQ